MSDLIHQIWPRSADNISLISSPNATISLTDTANGQFSPRETLDPSAPHLIGSSSTVAPRGEGCQTGDFFDVLGIILQTILAALAFSLLMIKRIKEPPDVRRPWKVWFFDTSKQAIGAALIHFINIFTSGLYSGDPCTVYIISFLLDSTLGILIIYVGLFISQVIARKRHLQHLLLGQYGNSNTEQLRCWLSQCAVYIVVLLIDKVIIALVMIPRFWHNVRDILLLPLSSSPDLELIVTMLVIPFTVNAIMFWLVDNFLMQRGQQERYTKIMTTLHNSRIVYGPNANEFDDAQVLIFSSAEEQRLENDINPFLADAQLNLKQ